MDGGRCDVQGLRWRKHNMEGHGCCAHRGCGEENNYRAKSNILLIYTLSLLLPPVLTSSIQPSRPPSAACSVTPLQAMDLLKPWTYCAFASPTIILPRLL